METKRGTASKRLSLDLSIENNYPNFTRERGSYFFAFLSIMIRSNLTTSVWSVLNMLTWSWLFHMLSSGITSVFNLREESRRGCVPSSFRPRITTYRIRLFHIRIISYKHRTRVLKRRDVFPSDFILLRLDISFFFFL